MHFRVTHSTLSRYDSRSVENNKTRGFFIKNLNTNPRNIYPPKGTCLFETLKKFYPPKGLCKENRRRSNCVLLMFYFLELGNVDWTFNLHTVFCHFSNLKMFYPPKGLCKPEPNGVHLDSFNFIMV